VSTRAHRPERRSYLGHAIRVAAAATVLIGIVYVGAMVVFDVLDANHLVAQVDTHLHERLQSVGHLPSPGPSRISTGEDDDDHDLDEVPVILWHADASGRVAGLSDGAPPLPASAWPRGGGPTTARLGGQSFRLESQRTGSGWLIAGQSLAETTHVERVLLLAEVIAGPLLLAALFLGTLVVGVKASAPVELARRRQLEFTADASHELRTPLSVIEAEVDLALGAPRDPAEYRAALERVGGESERLHHLVEELLWLARFDSEPPPPGDEPVDVTTIAEEGAERFRAVARACGIDLSVQSTAGTHAWISAPAEWIDRLTGVLVDNACRHAGSGGTVRLKVEVRGHRVSLAVEDSGPGIPPAEHAHLFDRFYRATTAGTGAGLGLAIADSIVRSTGGRWQIDTSDLGGAAMQVGWHRAGPRGPGATPVDHIQEKPYHGDRRPDEDTRIEVSGARPRKSRSKGAKISKQG
jgi:two-component system, OmpR family, sensor histidine kinase CiaH